MQFSVFLEWTAESIRHAFWAQLYYQQQRDIGSHSTHLPKIAPQGPNGTKPENRVKRFARWVDKFGGTSSWIQ
jgi:hypothetical protein